MVATVTVVAVVAVVSVVAVVAVVAVVLVVVAPITVLVAAGLKQGVSPFITPATVAVVGAHHRTQEARVGVTSKDSSPQATANQMPDTSARPCPRATP